MQSCTAKAVQTEYSFAESAKYVLQLLLLSFTITRHGWESPEFT